MGTSLSGLTPATTFDGLLKTSDNDALGATLKTIGTGDGTDSVLQLSDSALQIGGTFNVDGGIATFKGVGSSYLTSSFIIKNSADAEIFRVRDDGQIYATYISAQSVNASSYALYGADYAPNIRVNIKGSGATSATTSLLVQNSAGTDMLKVTDDGRIDLSSGNLYLNNYTFYNGAASLAIENDMIYRGFGSHRFTTYNGAGGYPEVMRITGNTSEPKVGIGETTPTARLHVKGSGNDNATTSLLVQNSDGTDLFDITDNGEVEVKSGDFRMPSYKSIYGGGSSTYAITLEGTTAMNFKSWAKDFAFNTQNGTIATLKNDGKFGLGETAPTAKLHIKGDGTGTADYSFKVQNAIGNNNMQIRDDGAVFLTNQRYTFNAAGGAVFKGSGATSATTALLVQNSAGTDLLKMQDDGNVLMSANKFQIQAGKTINYTPVGVGGASVDNSAVLQANSTTKGFLPPRMTDAEKNAIATPAAGLMVYDTDANQMSYWNGGAWVNF